MTVNIQGQPVPEGVELPSERTYRDAWRLTGNAVTIDMEAARAIRLMQIRDEGSRRMAALVPDYSPEERETWPVQIDEAKDVTADPNASAPLLEALASARGLTKAQMAATVLARRDAFRAGIAAVLSVQQAKEKAASEAANVDALTAISLTEGWA